MFVRTINIRREGDYGYGPLNASKPFQATISVEGTNHKTELLLSPEMSQRIVEIIAEEIVAAGRATAEAMVATAFDAVSLPAPEAA